MIKVNIISFHKVYLLKKSMLIECIKLVAKHHNIKNMLINIKISSQEEIKKLNFFYRKKNAVTNVLSFSFKEATKIKSRGSTVIFLGDIIICSDIVQYESLKQKKIRKYYLYHLLIHSILHLLGYEHVCNISKKKMEIVEAILLMKIKVPVPYIF